MDSIFIIVLGYVAWCSVAFVFAKFVKIESTSQKPVSFLFIVLAAPMVLLDIITGKGTFR